MSDVIPIVLGFVLTTVVGGAWAARLQARSWDRQNDLRLKEDEQQRAATACEEVSRLLDKRLYRMRRLFWAIANFEQSPAAINQLDTRLDDYNEVLYEWNDRLNMNLALVGSHFGLAARQHLYSLYEDFRRVGSQLEMALRRARQGSDVSPELDAIDPEFEGWLPGSLNSRVYLLGLAMMSQLREGLVGRRSPDKLAVPSLGAVDHQQPA